MGQHEDAAAARAAAHESARVRQVLAALAEERRGYVLRGRDDRVAQVDDQISAAQARLAVLDGGALRVAAEPVAPAAPPRGRRSAKDELAGLDDEDA